MALKTASRISRKGASLLVVPERDDGGGSYNPCEPTAAWGSRLLLYGMAEDLGYCWTFASIRTSLMIRLITPALYKMIMSMRQTKDNVKR